MKKKEIPAAPELGELAQYLDKLPPFIARKGVKYFTGGAFSAKKLANDDALCKGPLVRQKIGDTVVYPREHFLAYLAKMGVKTIVTPEI